LGERVAQALRQAFWACDRPSVTYLGAPSPCPVAVGPPARLRPSPSHHRSEAQQASAEQHKRRRLGYSRDHDLAVAGIEIGHQDLIDAGIERATPTAWAGETGAATAAPAAAVPSAAASAACRSTTPAKAATQVTAG
jgi:hypothetical protein